MRGEAFEYFSNNSDLLGGSYGEDCMAPLFRIFLVRVVTVAEVARNYVCKEAFKTDSDSSN